MLKAIVTWALNMRVLVVALAAALLVIGVNATRHAPWMFFPGIRAAAGGSPNRSARSLDRGGGCPGDRAAGKLAQRAAFLQTIRSKSVLAFPRSR